MGDNIVAKSKKEETEEERRVRKERERAERKAREQAEAKKVVTDDPEKKERRHKRDETEEERRVRKERERAERKAREQAEAEKVVTDDPEKKERRHKRDETEEERRVRKERERAERKAREQVEAEKVVTDDPEKKERRHKRDETEEERRVRKERERAERKAREEDVAGREQPPPPQQQQQLLQQQEQQLPNDSDSNINNASNSQYKTHGERGSSDGYEGVEEEESAVVSGGRREDLAAAMDAENNAIRRAADGAREAARREESRRAEAESERLAAERRERRRREREERRRGKENGVAEAVSAVAGTSSLGVADLQRQGYRSQFEKDMQRATALRRLVDMDDNAAVLVDIPPQSQYDLYIRSFGKMGRKQAGVQIPPEEDRNDAEVQVERVRVRHRGAQVPRDLGLYPEQYIDRSTYFTKDVDHLAVGDAVDEKDINTNEGALTDTTGAQIVDTTLLLNFLGRVFPVMRAVLDENEEDRAGPDATKSKSETQFSTSYTTLCFPGTRNRPVVKVAFNPCTPMYVAVLYGQKMEEGPSKSLDFYLSVILLWNIFDSSTPEKILVSPSLITCICMSPRRPYLVYGGAEDGSICLWDLREPERNHTAAGHYERNAFRLPSFATSWLSGNHTTSIVTVAVSGYNAVVGLRKDETEQLVSLDASGKIHFWFLNEKDQSKGIISDTENGLHMFSTVRLFLATSKNEDHTSCMSVMQDAFSLDFVPTDTSHYVVACAEGVRHISRFGSVAAPSLYAPSSHFFGRQIAVPSCVRYSTVDSRILLVGYDDGSLRLYLQTDGSPQLSIPLGIHRITEIRCSGTDKWLLWALDASGTLYLIDLAKKDKEFPVFSQTLSQPETGVCTCFDIPPEGKAESRLIVLGFEKGIVQLHTLSERTHPPSSDRDEHWL
ncbi:WDdomain 60 [Trypanosoma theileri]|uniref:WDdomain 60 n=1 Tax=Trypanosoma theileri TaxID=67003 RepID=A0A1X0P8I2_9TRYP|nr:WDdomain 60 [Trypanosoma theileri]ORC92740.1 WDdomain 60 [Trypanosoma theileri]